MSTVGCVCGNREWSRAFLFGRAYDRVETALRGIFQSFQKQRPSRIASYSTFPCWSQGERRLNQLGLSSSDAASRNVASVGLGLTWRTLKLNKM
jgi:hypothetical protein